MLETIWESRWLPDTLKKLIWGTNEAAGHLYRQLVLPVIRGRERDPGF